MSPGETDVSVIIPCYNHADLLPEAIASVRAQTIPAREIIVVDDGSPDDLAGIASRFTGVRYIRQSNQGLAGARNTGLRASEGRYVVFLDADDRLLPNNLAAGIDAFTRHPDAAFVCGDFRLLGEDPTWRHVHRCDPLPDHYGTLLRINFIGAVHVVMFRREILVMSGGFRKNLKACEDYDLLLRISRQHPMYCHHELIAEYRRYSDQMSQRWGLMLQCTLDVLREQLAWIAGNSVYEAAYREGVRRTQGHYGERALWEMVAQARAKNWRQVLSDLRLLVRYYPQGLFWLLQHKCTRSFMGRGRRAPC